MVSKYALLSGAPPRGCQRLPDATDPGLRGEKLAPFRTVSVQKRRVNYLLD